MLRGLRALAARAAPAPAAVHFVTLEAAASMKGVRVTFVPGVPAIFAECLKNLLDAKGVPYTRVLHPMMGEGDNQALLYRLTAQRSLPTMFYEDERPRNSWVEQVVLADKLGSGPSLIPTDPERRVAMFGMLNELMAEDGIAWNKRLLLGKNALTLKYGWSEQAVAEAPRRLAASMSPFLHRLRKAREEGSRYLLGGSAPTVLDIYFATVTYMLAPPGPEILPRTKQNAGLLAAFAANPPEVQALVDGTPYLLEYRDHVLRTHCLVPAALGGDPL